MTASAELLFANEAFYLAFQHRDQAAMEALWATGMPISCTHPGWRTLCGRVEVMSSWAGIFGQPKTPGIEVRGAQAREQGGMGLVTCYELLGNNVLCATNVFVREQGQWRIVHHHAGACRELQPEALGEEQRPLQ